MKVLCVIDYLGSGGAQKQLVELAKGLVEKGYEVSFLTYHKDDFYKSELINNGIKITCLIESNYLKRLWKMRSFIRQGNYSTVISFLQASNFICEIAALPFKKWKLIVGERSANPNILKSPKLRFYRWFHLFADYVVANSNENLKLVKKINPFLSDKKCKVIYNMVDLNLWSSPKEYVSQTNNKLRILVGASHRQLKNLRGLIEAVNLLDTVEKEKLIIDWYGDPGADSSFEIARSLIEKYSLQQIFNFYPATLELRLKMQYADIVGLFSYYEGLPNIICEAMAMGKPIICSAISDIPKLLNNRKNILFDPVDFYSIARSLKYVLSLSKEQIECEGKHNREIAQKVFLKEKNLQEYLELITN